MSEYTVTNELIVTLLNLKGIGRKTIAPFLVENFSSLQNISSIKEGVSEFRTYLSEKKKKLTFEDEDVEESKNKANFLLNMMINDSVEIIDIFSQYYPIEFNELENDRPLIIYAKGNIDLLTQGNRISIIGSRKVTDKVGRIGQRVSQLIAERGETIVSGLAIGSDTYGHAGALMVDNGKTIAILPSPLNNIVPTNNKQLAQDILDNNGLLISEYPYGTPLTKGTFIERDRLQASLGNGVFVIDTSTTGGTFHAINLAYKLNKPISCLSSKYTELDGNQKLFKDYNALIIDERNSIDEFCAMCDDYVANNLNKSKEAPKSNQNNLHIEQTTLF